MGKMIPLFSRQTRSSITSPFAFFSRLTLPSSSALKYKMPDAYDDQGRVNQEKRFAVSMQRYRDGGESWSKMNPFAEQEAWEKHQIGKATLKFGSQDKKQSAADYDYVFEDQIDFVRQSVMEGDNFQGKISSESLQESQAKSALEKLQIPVGKPTLGRSMTVIGEPIEHRCYSTIPSYDFPVLIEKAGLQEPKWLCTAKAIMVAKSLDVGMEIVIQADCSMEQLESGGWVACIGHVARDPISKKVLWFATGVCDRVSEDVNEGEMLTILYATFCARCLGFKKLILRNDNQDAVRILNLEKREDVPKGKKGRLSVKLPIFDSYQILRNQEILIGREHLNGGGAKIDLSFIPRGTERNVADLLSRAEREGGSEWKYYVAMFWEQVELDKDCIGVGRESFARRCKEEGL